ncbi:hypothetical protein VitviT2T_014147 [Vitis vinifera]|uniref:Uncharacterized protein n=1 Tax=Vitis vinifera TaxID=29760 RepID=A0ABY9CJU6_VITVI|nr:hypothetical protein VitviT2T_014147 [Vitis vinifera]
MGESSSSTPLSMDDIYTQVMGLERNGRVHGFGFGATPTLVFGATTKKETNAALASKLKETQKEIVLFKQREEEMQLQGNVDVVAKLLVQKDLWNASCSESRLFFTLLQGTLGDLSKGGRNLSLDHIELVCTMRKTCYTVFSIVVLVSNRFYFSFIVHPESKATTNGFGLQNVVPATEEEACHILKRMDAESLLREKGETGE